MQGMLRARGRRAAVVGVAALAAAAALAGCSDADGARGDASDADLAAAQSVVDEHIAIDKIGPSKPIEREIPSGEEIIYVNCGQPACTNQSLALAEASEALGWEFEEIVAGPTPEEIQAAFDEVLRRDPDMVASAGFGRDLYPRQLDALNDAGVVVMSTTGNEETGEGGIAYEPLGPAGASEGTAALANKTILDIEGDGLVGVVVLGGYPIVATYSQAYEDEILEKCPGCTVERLELQPTSLGKDAAQQIANFIRANPDMKAIFYSYDLMGVGVPAAAQGAGVAEMPKSYSWAPDAPGLQALQTGERTASVIMPYNELAWMLADAYARIATGGSPEDAGPTQPLQIVSGDLDNVPTEIEPYPASVTDYEDQFRALWGI
jgi:ABC-type sugar transport system substrate-binding protein